MAPTSDERREVAEMMRGPFDVYRHRGGVAIDGTIYGMTVHADYEGALRDGMRRLADLIDPTCHLIGTTSYDGVYPNGETHYVHELSCGHEVTTAWPEPPEFCPHCGARVTDGGER